MTEPVAAANVNAELQSICNAIASSVASQSGGHVVLQSLVLIFKQDARDKFWLLFCLSIKVEVSGEEPTIVHSAHELVLSVPEAVKTQKYDDCYPESKVKFQECLGCQQVVSQQDFCSLETEYLHRHKAHLSEELVERLLYSSNLNSFDSSPTSSKDTKRTTVLRVCLDCYMAITKPQTPQCKLPPARPLVMIKAARVLKISQSAVVSPKARSPVAARSPLPVLKPRTKEERPKQRMSISVHSQSYALDKFSLLSSTYKHSNIPSLPSTGLSTPANRSGREQFDFMMATIQKLKSLSLKSPSSYAYRAGARLTLHLAASLQGLSALHAL